MTVAHTLLFVTSISRLISRTSVLICIGCLFVVCSCNRGEERDTHNQTQSTVFRNDLLPTSVSIMYEHALEVPQEYFFFKGFGGRMFIERVVELSVKDSLIACYPFSTVVFSPRDVEYRLLGIKNEFSHIIFDEDWQLDTARFEMKKYVRSYTLVREYVRDADTVKKWEATFNAFNTVDMPFENLTLLARNVAYEVPLTNEQNPEFVENIPRKRAAQLIIDKVLNGEQAYSFNYRDTLQPLSLDEVKRRLGEEVNYEIMYDELDEATDTIAITRTIDINEFVGFAFIEDWYYNKATMRIYKDVKGIAPVRKYEIPLNNGEFETIRRIPLVLFFSNHKEGK